MKKTVFIFISVLAALFITASCSKDNDNQNYFTVAVLLPSGDSNPKWSQDAILLEAAISKYNYKVETYVAQETKEGAAKQVEQLREVINSGISNIVIAPVDDEVIVKSGVLDGKENLNIISYDRLIRNCNVVDYFIGCNQNSIGNMQGHFILQSFKASGKTPMSIELFAGPTSDNNSKMFFDGAMDLIEPYIIKGLLKVPSGKASFSDVSLPSWTTEAAKEEMAARLNETGVIPDFILATNDVIADGAIQAIQEFGYTGEKYPVITGLDNITAARKNILYGYQTMTIDKDLVPLADNTAMVVSCILSGNPVKTSFSVNNGVKDIPAIYSSFSLITYDDLKN